MAAELSRRDRARWAAAGIGMIDTKPGLELFGELLSAGGQVGALPVDWSRLLSNVSNAPLAPFGSPPPDARTNSGIAAVSTSIARSRWL